MAEVPAIRRTLGPSAEVALRRALPGFSPGDFLRLRDYYRRQYVRHRDPAEWAGWSGRESQEARFAVFAEALDLSGWKVLDVGCGAGDFYGYLRRRGVPCAYVGVDLFEWLVREARRRHPSGRFEVRNVTANPFPPASFDVAVLSGVFNVRVQDNWRAMRETLTAVLRQVRTAAAFNVLHGEAELREPDRFAVDPASVTAFARRLPGVREVRLLDHYHPNDLTLVLRKR